MVMSYSSSKSFNHKPLNPNTMKYLDTFTLDLVQNGDTIIERDGFYSTHLSQWKDKLTELELYVQILQSKIDNGEGYVWMMQPNGEMGVSFAVSVDDSNGCSELLFEDDLHEDVLNLLNY